MIFEDSGSYWITELVYQTISWLHWNFTSCVWWLCYFCYIFHEAVMATKGQRDFLSSPACFLSRWSDGVPLAIKWRARLTRYLLSSPSPPFSPSVDKHEKGVCFKYNSILIADSRTCFVRGYFYPLGGGYLCQIVLLLSHLGQGQPGAPASPAWWTPEPATLPPRALQRGHLASARNASVSHLSYRNRKR